MISSTNFEVKVQVGNCDTQIKNTVVSPGDAKIVDFAMICSGIPTPLPQPSSLLPFLAGGALAVGALSYFFSKKKSR